MSQEGQAAENLVRRFSRATYWQIGHDIVEFEQGGNVRARYGKALLKNLSRDLSLRHGKGFSCSNVIYMRLLYLHYQKGQKPSDLLSWSQHVELLRIEDPLERSFYEQLITYSIENELSAIGEDEARRSPLRPAKAGDRLALHLRRQSRLHAVGGRESARKIA